MHHDPRTPPTPPPPPNTLFPIDVTSIPTQAIWPYAQQWSLGLQRELPNDFVVNLAYVGSKGTHLTVERQLNQRPPLPLSENPFGPNEPMTLADCTVAPPSFSGPPGAGGVPFQLQGGTVGPSIVPPTPTSRRHAQIATFRMSIPLPARPYPGLGRIFALQNVANSDYNAFQFTARHTTDG